MDIKQQLSTEFKINLEYASNIVDLIGEGSTIPFIARYRKEMHGGCDDTLLRDFADRLTYLTNLEKRKAEVRGSIETQGKWSEELELALNNALTLTEVEDIYRPYKQKKKTRASVAIERGLAPLAEIIFAQEVKSSDIKSDFDTFLGTISTPYINNEMEIDSIDDVIAGALDIIAEWISDDAENRKRLRKLLHEQAVITTCYNTKQTDESKQAIYEMYKEFSEKLSTLPSHRILAINRGESEECLKASVVIDEQLSISIINKAFKKESIFDELMDRAIADSYKRLIFPSVEREVRAELTEKANEQAIKMFESNLRPLLMQPPLKGKVIMGFDPGYRTGCKVAIIDSLGNVLDHTVVYPTIKSDNMTAKAKEIILSLIKKHKVDVISIGNGTASKESEIFIAELIKDSGVNASYIVVNEAGASVYSASKLGAEEFPEYDVTTRSAVSIARRLQDPLAELIKIDVKSIGVGQYQHDMPQKRLTEVLDGVVEDCVNSVGVDVNTASYSLLSHIAGLTTTIAKNIVEKRKTAPFKNRKQLLEVNKLGAKAYEQCAGFIRIAGGDVALDCTAVHPESYQAVNQLLKRFNYTENDIILGKLDGIKEKVASVGFARVAQDCGIGEPTLHDIIAELIKPGRDIRDSLPAPILRADLLDINSLSEGMELSGTVRNVIDFGAFIDIGVHQDGLVHISEISSNFIKHPSEALTVGQQVTVKIISLDKQKNRISLSIKQATPNKSTSNKSTSSPNPKQNPTSKSTSSPNPNKPQDLQEMLKKLQSKFKS